MQGSGSMGWPAESLQTSCSFRLNVCAEEVVRFSQDVRLKV